MKSNVPSLLKEVPLTELEGKKLKKTNQKDKREIIFYTADNERYVLRHDKLKNKDIIGKFDDLLGCTIIRSKPTFSAEHPYYKELMSNLRINTKNSSVLIKWYCDYKETKEKTEKVNR